ncbi:MAG: histidine phosphatase family protein [Gammaproteobacteria bacterium]|nr:histidine phosphatase family protein [Gammaproteobacteria bacterium]
MEIVLIRHGKPKIETTGIVSAADFGEWVSRYDKAGIDDNHSPSGSVIERAAACGFTVCSDLPRSIESAKLLNLESPEKVSSMFRECEMPYGKWKYPKLSKSAWSVIFRLLQLAGYSGNSESYREIKERSKVCASQLVELAQSHGSVLFVGHGALNWFLHKELKKLGWSGPDKSTKKHWEFGEYFRNET